jgi:hypothetical protein
MDRGESSLDGRNNNGIFLHTNPFHLMHEFPKLKFNKNNGLDLVGWVGYLKQYFSLQGIEDNHLKHNVVVLYFDWECW